MSNRPSRLTPLSIKAGEVQVQRRIQHLTSDIRSPRALAWRRFRAHRMALVGTILMLMVVIYITGGALVFSEADANATGIRNRWAAPSAEHPFGTDSAGRDVLARTIYGGQISLAIAAFSVMVTVGIGIALGLVAGYYEGIADAIIMRLAEALLSIPLLFLLLVLSRFIGTTIPDITLFGRTVSGSVGVLVLILGCTGWMPLTRIVRANVLSLKNQDYVQAARALGAGDAAIMFRHILPNTLSPVIVFITLGISQAILIESYASFLGLGVQQPTASLGNMIQRSLERIDSAPWTWLPWMASLQTRYRL
jgi:ABC-type dipeptide/oligopeptide/nickel transport system permease subunit